MDWFRWVMVGALCGAFGCGDDDATSEVDAGPVAMVDAGAEEVDAGDDVALPATLGGDRPSDWTVPPGYDGSPTPLILLVHGYGASGGAQSLYLGMERLARTRGFILITPDGTRDASDRLFWNATDACCDFGGVGVDDVAYLTGLVEEASSLVNVDPERVYAFGHSNGGFMSYRLACDSSETFTAIASLAGATYLDDARCTPAEPTSVLQIHGTEDDTIQYAGAEFFPSAQESVEVHAARASCSGTEDGDTLDLVSSVDGEETTTTTWTGCDDGYAYELWTIEGGAHLPVFNREGPGEIVDWLLAR